MTKRKDEIDLHTGGRGERLDGGEMAQRRRESEESGEEGKQREELTGILGRIEQPCWGPSPPLP
jgi:hypothetical protein